MPVIADSRAAARDLLDFIAASPSPFHAVEAVHARLSQAGFQRLEESDPWKLEPGGRYSVVRNGSSIVAFIAGMDRPDSAGCRLVGTHLDSPALKLKPEPVIEGHGYIQLGVEVYGGALLNSWLDRDLGLAGRVLVEAASPRRSRGLAARPAAHKGRRPGGRAVAARRGGARGRRGPLGG